MSDLRIGIDLSHAERNAIAVRERLIALRTKYALGAYEYCREVVITPTVLPYSHPVIRLIRLIKKSHFIKLSAATAAFIHHVNLKTRKSFPVFILLTFAQKLFLVLQMD